MDALKVLGCLSVTSTVYGVTLTTGVYSFGKMAGIMYDFDETNLWTNTGIMVSVLSMRVAFGLANLYLHQEALARSLP